MTAQPIQQPLQIPTTGGGGGILGGLLGKLPSIWADPENPGLKMPDVDMSGGGNILAGLMGGQTTETQPRPIGGSVQRGGSINPVNLAALNPLSQQVRRTV